jgi:fructose-1,6-bisphosphatase/sedoheptulose 1,7-bisphosphatase-like protein
MAATTVRIKTETHEQLKRIAECDGVSLTEALDRIVERARRQRIVDQANEVWAAMRADPVVWADYQAEVALFDGAIADGLPEEPDGSW